MQVLVPYSRRLSVGRNFSYVWKDNNRCIGRVNGYFIKRFLKNLLTVVQFLVDCRHQ